MKPNLSIIGHEKRWAALARAFDKGQVPQTLLISGPPQVGKWTLALRYAQLLLCPNLQQITNAQDETLPAPCGQCRFCHQVEIETFPDFRVYRPLVTAAKDERDWVIAPDMLEGSIITVDVARKFGDEALRKPLVGARKVMVINQADRMNIEAQNALLKTFEEPVRNLSIVLLTDNPNQLLPTVYSRCWHMPLGYVAEAAIADWLTEISEASGIAITAIQEAVRVGGGRPGAAHRELMRLQRANTPAAPEGKTGPKKAISKASNPPTAALSRFAQASTIVERISRSQPVGALGLTEEASRLARLWWDEDQAEAKEKDLKKGDAKVQRSAVARFLDELSNAYRVRWLASVEGTPGKGQRGAGYARPGRANGSAAHPAMSQANGSASAAYESRSIDVEWASGLDQIRKTRHYILRNANTTLALDVMFGHLIALHRASPARAGGVRGNPPGRY